MKETNIPSNDNKSDGKAMLVLEDKHGSRVIYDRNSISVTEKNVLLDTKCRQY